MNSGADSPAARIAASSASTGPARSGSASTMAATNMSPLMPPTRSRWIASESGESSNASSGDDRDDIGSFGHHGHGGIAGASQRSGQRGIDRIDRFDAGQAALLGIETRRVELHTADAGRLQLH